MVKATISIPNMAALSTSAVTKDDVEAVLACCSVALLLNVSRCSLDTSGGLTLVLVENWSGAPSL